VEVPPVKGRPGGKGGGVARTTCDEAALRGARLQGDDQPYVSKLTTPVYSGKLEAGGRVLNVTTGKTERIAADDARQQPEEIEEATQATLRRRRLKQTETGDTGAPDAPIMLEHRFPDR
jgi:elongation factor G